MPIGQVPSHQQFQLHSAFRQLLVQEEEGLRSAHRGHPVEVPAAKRRAKVALDCQIAQEREEPALDKAQ